MKKIYFTILIMMLAVSLSACGHTHTWKDATCTEPKICSECGEKEGSPIGHSWKEATCTESKTCTICGEKQGNPIGHIWEAATCTKPKTCTVCGVTEGAEGNHSWKEATCTEPKICTVCGEKEGDPIEHVWEEATCTKPKTCNTCGLTEGEMLGHIWIEATCTEPKTCSVCGKKEGIGLGHIGEGWTNTKDATCTEKGIETGVCTVCGEEITRETEYAEHTPGDWEIKTKATISTNGKREKKCIVCGKVLETENYELEPFDISKIKKRSDFKYDDFTKSWKYYASYDKKYSDATESIGIIMFSEDNGTNIEDIEIRAALYWKDAAATPWVVEDIEFLIGDKIYHMDMKEASSGSSYFSILYKKTSYEFIKDLADVSKLKIKIDYGHHSSEFDLSSNPFKTFCKDIVDNNMWDYYVPSTILEAFDTTTVR